MYKRYQIYFQNKLVLELGAGLGCPGITSASFGATVILTDTNKSMKLLEYNIARNSHLFQKYNGTAVSTNFNWSKQAALQFISTHQSFNIILIADCIYCKHASKLLIESLEVLVKNDTEVFICQELRDSQIQKDCFKEFLLGIQSFLIVKSVPFNEQNSDFRSRDILLFSCRRK